MMLPNGSDPKTQVAEDIQEMRKNNAQLTQSNAQLRRRVAQLEKVCKGHMLMKSTLVQAEIDCQSAKTQVQALQRKLQTLEAELEYVKKRTTAEKQRHVCSEDRMNSDQGMLNNRVSGEQEVVRVTELQVKLSELERKYDMQMARHEQLTREMSQLRQLAPASSPLPSLSSSTQHNSLLPGLAAPDYTGSRTSASAAMVRRAAGGGCGDRQYFDVYVAKYSYDPVQYSPNDNPEAELKLNAGDYIFIYGPVDEDGFYDGELMDGRRGLVPSNFVQKVSDEELVDFHMHSSSSNRTTDLTSSDQQTAGGTRLVAAPSGNRCHVTSLQRKTITSTTEDRTDVIDGVESITTTSSAIDRLPGICVSELVPEPSAALCEIGFPRDLRLERQLVSSVLMAWSPPDHVPQSQIQSYQVYVDGQLKATIRGNDRTKALLEKVDIAKVHRVSVRTVTNRGQSKDQQCTVLIGKEVSMMPTDVQMLSIASTSAVVGWTPGSSSLEHIITVNGMVRSTIRAGGYRCTITGLKTVTSYSVSVQPRFGNAQQQAALTVLLNFTTLRPELPDAPAEVQVEPGPQHGTLLVMWLPVKITERSCASPITGYSVYIDGRRVKEMASPTGDHVLLESQDFASVYNPRQITIRTRTTEKESNDSAPVTLSPEMLAEIRYQNCQTEAQRSSSSGVQSDSRLQTPGPMAPNSESGFSASQLSPMELRFGPVEGGSGTLPSNAGTGNQLGATNGYAGGTVHNAIDSKNTTLQPLQPAAAVSGTNRQLNVMTGTLDGNRPGIGLQNALHHGKQLPQIEITRDNNGSLSDSSFDVESEENFDRRRGGANSLPAAGANPSSSRLANHHHGRSASGRHHSGSGRHSSGDHVVPLGAGRRAPSSESHRSPRGGHVTESAGSTGQPSRMFVALFDYDPATMSPNPNAINDELPFREGQIIKILRSRDPDGFYLGEIAGRRGLIPSNMVSEVDEDTGVAGNRTTANHVTGSRLIDGGGEPPVRSRKDVTPPSPRRHHKHSGGKGGRHDEISDNSTSRRSSRRHMIAAYNYDSNNQSDLSFKSGDQVTVFGDPDEDGFYYAEIDGRRGLVPADYLRDNPGSTSSAGLQSSSVAPSGQGGPRSTVGAGTTSTNERRSRSTGGQSQGYSPQVQQSTNSIDRGASVGGPQPQTGTGARHHHDPGTSTSRSRRHRSADEDVQQSAGGGRLAPSSTVSTAATVADRPKSSAGGPSGLDTGSVGARDRGNRPYSGGVNTVPDRQLQQR